MLSLASLVMLPLRSLLPIDFLLIVCAKKTVSPFLGRLFLTGLLNGIDAFTFRY